MIPGDSDVYRLGRDSYLTSDQHSLLCCVLGIGDFDR